MISRVFRYIKSNRPRPFLKLQEKLGITEEWAIFKSNIVKHKYKVLLISTVSLYPFYPKINEMITLQLSHQIDESFKESKNLRKTVESHLKKLIEKVLKDKQIKREGGLFVEQLAKQKIVQDSVVSLLASSVKDEEFIKEAKVLTKYLAHEILNDKEIESDLAALITRALRDPELRLEVTEAVKFVFTQDDSKEVLVNIFREAFKDERLREALQEAFTAAFTEILLDNDISDKLKLFSYFLLEKETARDGTIKVMADKILGNLFSMPTSREISDIEKLVEEDKEVVETMKQRKENSEKDKGRKYFF